MTNQNPHTRETLDFDRDPWDDTELDPVVELDESDLEAPELRYPQPVRRGLDGLDPYSCFAGLLGPSEPYVDPEPGRRFWAGVAS